jgi:hypothetical protein
MQRIFQLIHEKKVSTAWNKYKEQKTMSGERMMSKEAFFSQHQIRLQQLLRFNGNGNINSNALNPNKSPTDNFSTVSANFETDSLPSRSLGSFFEFSNPISEKKTVRSISYTRSFRLPNKHDDYNYIKEDEDEDSQEGGLKEEEVEEDMETVIEMSMMEIYNEQVYDLLNDSWGGGGGQAIDSISVLRLGTDGIVSAPGVATAQIHDLNDAMNIYAKGSKIRAKASTLLNVNSSRSHLVVQINIAFQTVDEHKTQAKLYLVDLAGSERVQKSGVTGAAMKEAQYINRSLLALGDVMEALDKKQQYVPYR